MNRHRRTRLVRVVAATAVAGALACSDGDDSATISASLDFPAPLPAPTRAVAREDFAGAEACRACHQEEYAAWAGSTPNAAATASMRSVSLRRMKPIPVISTGVSANTATTASV